ncbi:hypothetical protein Tsubulata_018114 [Turnera subulata]|uniref:UDP-N-acetylmuramoyl-L-alanyl-D-glutamate--2,6-diaminopimelate ligase MurE homolog, chloroplastic n=1 Tax=Turnera subulata TaxID=218843 RepID=A0A9Q0FJQ2_9ROSI|nr:hypothetical protein Tsubulata_018114 [Turnera subulata]
MAFTPTFHLHSLSPLPNFLSLKPHHRHHHFCFRPTRHHFLPLTKPTLSPPHPQAIGPDGKFYPDPTDDDPPEAPEDTAHGVSKYQQVLLHADRARRRQEEDYKKNQSVYVNAVANSKVSPDAGSGGDDLFGEIDRAIVSAKQDFVRQGLIKPKEEEESKVQENEGELEPEEKADMQEIDQLQEGKAEGKKGKKDKKGSGGLDLDSSFDINFDLLMNPNRNIAEPKFRMSLAELLDESKVVPVSVAGNLEVEVSGIQHDSRLVAAGDLFVCCVGERTDGHLYLTEADKRGAVAVVASQEIDIEETLGCKALVIVEDTNAVLPALAAAFYKFPTKNLAVIGITGASGKTTTAHLVKGMYGAMGLRTGMLSTVASYVHGDIKLASVDAEPDAVLVQNLAAKMLHNGTETLVMEASAQLLASGRCSEVDFDIAVFTNLSGEHSEEFNGTEDEYRDAQAKLFARMVDPERHRKVVNIDDPNAPFFIAQGSPDVPVVTFAMEDKNADVHLLKFELSLFETLVLVNTPHGILEISSGLLARHNIPNILAAVAVGIAVGAPLEDIVRGIEEIDVVPGRCELIDEEQAYGVIVDHARTPEALSRLLDAVRELRPKRIITVIGCVGEGERGKRPVMTKIATDKSEVTMLTSDNPKNEDPLDILDDMLAGVGWTMQEYLNYGQNDYYPPLKNGHRLFLHDIRTVAVRCAVAMGEEGDVVVVTGKGHETHQLEGDEVKYFDDREECREALQCVDDLHQAGIDTSEFPWRLPESY